jgi:hypothetical protein
MGNKITEKYFEHENFNDRAKTALKDIITKTKFQPETEIFRGQIYDNDKVGSLIYKGIWQDKPAVLKIQVLQPEIDEIDIIERFNSQNESTRIRLPRLYDGLKWNAQNGYGYLILEYVDAPKIYQPPFADAEQVLEFCALYQEYKTNCLRKPLFTKEPNELSSLVYSAQRISHWVKIAQTKAQLSENAVKCAERYLSLAGRHMPSIAMEFMHGHFTYDDIYKLSGNEYVLMSNLFWSYRPEYYDATFHLWAGIKSLRDRSVNTDQIIKYLKSWIDAYTKLSVILNGIDFERKFNMMMSERCVGAILVDIQNQHYQNDRARFTEYLSGLFGELFKYFANKLENA